MYRAQRREKSDRKGSLEEILANRDLLHQFHAELGGGFKHFSIFHPIWGRFPFSLRTRYFFTGVETTNQKSVGLRA